MTIGKDLAELTVWVERAANERQRFLEQELRTLLKHYGRSVPRGSDWGTITASITEGLSVALKGAYERNKIRLLLGLKRDATTAEVMMTLKAQQSTDGPSAWSQARDDLEAALLVGFSEEEKKVFSGKPWAELLDYTRLMKRVHLADHPRIYVPSRKK